MNQPVTASKETVFEQATRVFDGTTDAETGLRVLRLRKNPAGSDWPRWRMIYHQNPTFHDSGRKTMFEYGFEPHSLDLTTGVWTQLLPSDYRYTFVHPSTGVATISKASRVVGREAVIVNLHSGQELNRFGLADWYLSEATLLADGHRAVAQFWQGAPHEGETRSRFYLMDSNGNTSLFMEVEGYFCNHVQGCPTDADLIAYDRWPSPCRDTEQVIHLMRVDGSDHHILPMLPETVRPGKAWGWQRDHFVWTPDGRRIVSYFNIEDDDSGDHFVSPGWWVNATDWRTGEELAAPYPAGRWGCNFNVSPDSRFIVAGGGPDFGYIYHIDIEGLREGWNERVLCRYAPTEHDRVNLSPYHMPWVLPDQSGVIFAAGWYGDEDGIYMVEWPQQLR